MKSEKLLFFVLFFMVLGVSAQNLHTQANAASIDNEANTVTGWTTNNRAIATSSAVNPFAGSFSISVALNGSTGGYAGYTFTAVVGEVYDISIWAREGNLSFRPAFANWSGFSNFSTTAITGSNWTQYTWSLTATTTSPEIRVYAAPWSGGQAGTEVLIDNVSITLQGSGADTEAPSAPSNLTASGTTTTTTNLSWNASTDNVGVTGYTILQDGASIGTTNGATTFNVTGLTQNTSYAFTVTASDAAGNVSAASNTANVTTETAADNQPPSAPSNLTASGTTTTTTNLSWNASTDNVGVTGYTILQDGVSIGTTSGATTFNVTGLTQNTSYAFTVTASDAAGNVSAASNTANVTTETAADNQPPSAPSNLTASGTTTTTTNLSWNASTDNVGVTGYTILQDGASIGTTNGATNFNVTGLTQNTSYAFTVTASDAAGNVSAASNTANVTTDTAADGESPSAPTNLTAANTTNTTTDLSWDASTDNVGVTGYTILQDGASIGTTNGATTFNVTGLTQNTSYAFTVTARDAAGNVSAVSNTANVTTTGTGVVDYTSENANLATVDWNARDLFANRNVGIGTTNTQGYQLAVAGSVVAEEVNVKLQVNWPDYVFENSYNLPTLEEVEAHIQANGYLLNMPSAAQVEQSGIDIGKMNAKLLRKIEELTLYTLAQEKKIKALEEQNKKLESISQKIAELEKAMEEKR
ncbi:hypothetical protein EHW67_07715 [Arenibacter aquaticus]|uniref:Fibronectin type-III domain-containing protein n=1 Tax=Arenibacter aquaticus TaxID=2489054 RepID=A0A3S0AZ84_9FLAO|nr:fibronectin type III domain-containing protein [Arenibacter aquaticus]RTE53813.1 hypothetical protein EHW67_07715 [Arenibacter aquaticus]